MRRIVIIAVTVLVAFLITLYKLPTDKVAAQEDCAPYKVIYARGSGQSVADSAEFRTLKSTLGLYGVSQGEIIELDSSAMHNNSDLSYPAVSAVNWGGVLAILSRNNLGGYKESVDSGKELLIDYITNSNFLQCGTRLVLTGYSQGAHVITESIFDNRIRNYLPQISYVATFGDPTLDLNTILGGDAFAATPWYRGNAAKYINGGSVHVRNPYVPASLQNRVGAWCEVDDVICTGNAFQIVNQHLNNPHGKYSKKAIPAAAREIAQRLREDLQIPFTVPQCGALKQDIVVALNVSPSVAGDRYFDEEQGVKKLLDGLYESSCDTRIGLVTFGRSGHEPTQPEFDLGYDYAQLSQVLYDLDNRPKSNVVEKVDIASAIDMGLDFTWRDDAQKMVLVMSDAPGDNYPLVGGTFKPDLLKTQPEMRAILEKSRAKGGVEIHAAKILHPTNDGYVYTPGSVQFYDYMAGLVADTAGTYRDKVRCDWCSWLDIKMELKTIQERKPIVSVPNVRIKQGETIELAAKDISGGVIPEVMRYPSSRGINYTWYTDCEKPELESGYGITYSFTAQKSGSCTGSVLAREMSKKACGPTPYCIEASPHEIRAVSTFTIEILPADYTPPPVPGPVTNITKNRFWDDDILRITWDAPANADEIGEIAYVIKDEDGAVIGVTKNPTIDITDVADTENPVVLVATASENGMSVPASSVDAEDISGPQPSPVTATPTPAPGSVLGSTMQQPAKTIKVHPITSLVEKLPFGADVLNVTRTAKNGVEHVGKVWKTGSWWTKLTIVAVPLSGAAAIGFAIKYGLRLAARRY